MFGNNPFSELSAFISPVVMQAYVVSMIVLVAAGTFYDIKHKKSDRYFFNAWRNARNREKRQVGGGEIASLAIKTVVEGLTSGDRKSVV